MKQLLEGMAFLVVILFLTSVAGAQKEGAFPTRLRQWEKKSLADIKALYLENMKWRRDQYAKEATWKLEELAALKDHADLPFDKASYARYIDEEVSKRAKFLDSLPDALNQAFNESVDDLEYEVGRRLEEANKSKTRGADAQFPEVKWRAFNRLDNDWVSETSRRSSYYVYVSSFQKPVKPEYEEFAQYKGKAYAFTHTLGGMALPDAQTADALYDEYVKFLNGEKTASMRSDRNGAIYYKGKEVGFRFWFPVEEKKEEKIEEKKEEKKEDPKPEEKKEAGDPVKREEPKKEAPKKEEPKKEERKFVEITDATIVADIKARIRYRILLTHVYKAQVDEMKATLVGFAEGKKRALVAQPFNAKFRQPEPKPARKNEELLVEDRFGRPLNEIGVPLVDWEGYIANPAIRFQLRAPKAFRAPVLAEITTETTRIYFDLPSTTNAKGSRKVVALTDDGDSVVGSFLMSIWPDRDGDDEEHTLKIEYWEAPYAPANPLEASPSPTSKKMKVTVKVRDLDPKKSDRDTTGLKVARPSSYPFVSPSPKRDLAPSYPYVVKEKPKEAKVSGSYNIMLDFTEDDSKFFSNGDEASLLRQKIAERARDDWSEFLDDHGNEVVREGDEKTQVKKDGREGDNLKEVRNKYPYRDFLLYVTATSALQEPTARGAAEGSGFQNTRSGPSGLKRSGHILIEGVNNEIGYSYFDDDNDWWKSVYGKDKPVDLYSFLIHEIGHALFAHKNYASWATWLDGGAVGDVYVQDYQHGIPKIDSGSHLSSDLDFASQKGAFGAVKGRMPQFKWILTKLDLLMVKAMGYRLKKLSFLEPLKLDFRGLSTAKEGKPYREQLKAGGGIPTYEFSVLAGSLPDGLALDSFTGEISGTPKEKGNHYFLIGLRDNTDDTSAGIVRSAKITVE